MLRDLAVRSESQKGCRQGIINTQAGGACHDLFSGLTSVVGYDNALNQRIEL